MDAQRVDTFYNQILYYVSLQTTFLTFDKGTNIIWKALISDEIQELIPPSLRTRIYNLPIYPELVVHPQKRRMLDSLSWDLYSLHMVKVSYKVVKTFSERSPTGINFDYQNTGNCFHPLILLNLWPLTICDRFQASKLAASSLSSSDRFSIFSRAIPKTGTTSTQVANIFFNDWIVP